VEEGYCVASVSAEHDEYDEYDEYDRDDDADWDWPHGPGPRMVREGDPQPTRHRMLGTVTLVALAAVLTFGIVTVGTPSQSDGDIRDGSPYGQWFPTDHPHGSPDDDLGAGESPAPTGSDGTGLELTLSAASGTVAAGSATQLTVSVATPTQEAEIGLAASGVPAGASASFSPPTVQPGQSATLTLSTSTGTPIGAHVITVEVTTGNLYRSQDYALTVTAPVSSPTSQPPPSQPTIPPTGPATGVVNGGFESGLSGWTSSGSVSTVTNNVVAGSRSAKLGADTPTNDSKLSQTFTAPSSGTISFHYRMVCNDIVVWDWFTVSLKNLTTGQSVTVVPRMCKTTAFQQASAPITAGHRYEITFLNHDDNWPGDASWSYVDEVTIGP
jgi:hypothetical protein